VSCYYHRNTTYYIPKIQHIEKTLEMPHSKIIEQRLRFLRFDNETVQTLQQAQDLFKDSIDDMLDNMYAHILGQPELKSLFPNKESMERARSKQKMHWQKILFSESFGEKQFEQTKIVGQTHLQVGLVPSAYMSAYCFMLNQSIVIILKKYRDDPKKLTKIVRALNKAVILDMSFVIEAYIEAKNANMKEILRRATKFSEDVKHLADDLTGTVQKLNTQAESFVNGNDKSGRAQNDPVAYQATIRQFLKHKEELSEQMDKLNARLAEIKSGDRFYFKEKPNPDFFTRLKIFLKMG